MTEVASMPYIPPRILCMVQKLITCERFAWQLPANKKSGSKVAGKREGERLANSVTEDIGNCLSLRPNYSAKASKNSRKWARNMKRREKLSRLDLFSGMAQ